MTRLAQHGPVSAPILSQMLEPRMTPRKLWLALQRLHERGLVDRRDRGDSAFKGVYYELSREVIDASTAPKIFQFDREELLCRRVSRRHIFAQEHVQLWMYTYSNALPNAKLYRHLQIVRSPELKDIFCKNGSNDYLYPNALITFRGLNDEDMKVAIDYERHGLSREGVVRKLKRYAECRDLDGIIYIVQGESGFTVAEFLRDAIDRNSILKERSESKSFFTFSDEEFWRLSPLIRLLDRNALSISFDDWYRNLSEQRRMRANR